MSASDIYRRWIGSGALSESEIDELKKIENDPDEIESRFFGQLEFGTAGLRGVMGMGTARMNVHVIRYTTQAFADVINGSGVKEPKCAVCFDCRIFSRSFAETAASVLAANGIRVLLFSDMRPTPELSFAVRYYKCTAGINITASHNPKEYNGYKVYGEDGAQLSPQKAERVAKRMAELDMFRDVRLMPLDEAVKSGMVRMLGSETDDAFLEKTMEQMTDPHVMDGLELQPVYTPFHGTGRELVPEALRRLGVKTLHCVPEQMIPDGSFPTVVSPNPENPEGFYLAEALADKVGSELIIGTDPDADRVGIMVRGKDGRFFPMSGNRTGALLCDYIIGALRRSGRMPEAPVVLKTIVSTELVRRIAEAGGVRCVDCFTGFKFMAERKNQLEESGEGRVIFSFEESYGYMLGDHVRDKDAVSASLLITEMAAYYKRRGMTLEDALESLFERYGRFDERTVNLMMPGLDGAERMRKLMERLRSEPPRDICGTDVASLTDYACGAVTYADGRTEQSGLSGSNVLRFALDDGTVIVVRPSGTEPKIKIYVLATGTDKTALAEKTEKYEKWARSLAE